MLDFSKLLISVEIGLSATSTATSTSHIPLHIDSFSSAINMENLLTAAQNFANAKKSMEALALVGRERIQIIILHSKCTMLHRLLKQETKHNKRPYPAYPTYPTLNPYRLVARRLSSQISPKPSSLIPHNPPIASHQTHQQCPPPTQTSPQPPTNPAHTSPLLRAPPPPQPRATA